MRISTSSIYESGSTRMSELQAAMAKNQSQIASGLRITSPSDDPVAAARAVEVSQSLSINTQFTSNRNVAKSSLSQTESSLSSVADLLDAAKSNIVTAGSGTLDDTQRSYIATSLRSQLDQLIALANSKDGSGNYQFSGYQTSAQPFTQTATGAQYNGDQGQRLVQVGSSRQMAITETGQSIFQGGGQDIFKTLTDAITLLETPTGGGNASLTTGLATANTNLDKAIDNVSTVRASIGSRLSELDTLDNLGSSFDVQYQKDLGDLQNLDYNKAITTLSQQQVTLEAAQKSYLSITGLSLFNYINP